jgi:aryl-alcohol dehydrogenase-like predicted oxidoreductase
MKYRELGKTGIQVSEIGFGAWGIGGSSKGAIAYGSTDDEESSLALRTAFNLGINFYDTSDIYGFGHSQELIGEAFKDCRTNIVIASKVGFLNFDGIQDFSPRHIRNTVETSLKYLQTDYIDLYQLHSPPIDLIKNEDAILSTLETLKQQGKIRAIGISVRSPDDGIIAVNQFNFEVVQVNFNMVDQRALENGLLDLCRRKSVGVIIRTPLCFGFLTGKYTSADILDPQDHRGKWNHRQIEKWANAYKIFMENLTHVENLTIAQIALRFCLSFPGVSTVIPGMLTKKQVEENVASSQMGALSSTDLQSVVTTYKKNFLEWQQIDRNI